MQDFAIKSSLAARGRPILTFAHTHTHTSTPHTMENNTDTTVGLSEEAMQAVMKAVHACLGTTPPIMPADITDTITENPTTPAEECDINWDDIINDWDAVPGEPAQPVVQAPVQPAGKMNTQITVTGDEDKDNLEYTDPDLVAHVLSNSGAYDAGEVFAMKNLFFHKDQSGAQYARRAMYGKKILDVLYKGGLLPDYKAAYLMVADTNMDTCQAASKCGGLCCNPASANSFFCGKHRKNKTYDDGLSAMVVNRRRELEDGSGKEKDRRSISCKRAKKSA